MKNDLNRLSEAEIESQLSGLPPSHAREPYPVNFLNLPRRRAGVLVPFTRIGRDWHLLFIRRTDHKNDHHGGQVAFPGGGMDPGDHSIVGTALREANEEVGLAPEKVRILGRLEDVISITNYHVTPVVGSFPSPYPYLADPNEVARIFTIPLGWLADPGNREIQFRKVDGHDPWPVIYFKQYDGEILWGFTAALTVRLLEVLDI